MKKITLFLLCILAVANTQAQDNILEVTNHGDCSTALEIETNKTVGPTTAPVGYGEALEFNKNSRKDIHFMERENNTVWYKFETKTKGDLVFELEPLDTLNDYDFALYKYTDEGFCAAVQAKKILPIRTNFSRNKLEIGGKTGLKASAKKEFVAAGINPAYSQALPVEAKEIYVLVVNNVYNDGGGHLLHFNYLVNMNLEDSVVDMNLEDAVVDIEEEGSLEDSVVNMNLKGTVVDIEGGGPLEANITLTNTKTGAVVAEMKSDSVTGTYRLTFDLPKTELGDKLHLEFSKDGYFFEDIIIKASDIATKMKNLKVKTKIKKLKKGDSFVVKNILFHGNSPKPLPQALPSIKALYKLMKRNKTLQISIEGHTNGCSGGEDFSMKLSTSRAKTVYNYLIENDINEERLQSVGHGCKFMLFSNEQGRYAHLNRRVEIKILEL